MGVGINYSVETGEYLTPMPITKLECRERRARVTNSGTEITRVFYVEPYDAHVTLISALLGTVNDDGSRNEPATDGYLDYCYCVEAQLESFDKLAMLGSPTMNVDPNGNQIFPADKLGTADLNKLKSAQDNLELPWGTPSSAISIAGGYGHGSVGAYVTAIYKPLVFCLPSDWGAQGTLVNKWDMVNPVLSPITKVANCGKKINYLVNIYGPLGAKTNDFPLTDADAFVTQPMAVFTIERKMVRVPPLRAIDALRGKVNQNSFQLTDNLVIYNFPAETLRFDDPIIEKMIVPSNTGAANVWFNITYNFTFFSLIEEQWDNVNQIYKLDYVGFNRGIGCPMDGDQPAQLTANPLASRAHTAYYRIGWKTNDPFLSGLFGGFNTRPLYLTDGSHRHGALNTPYTFRDLFINGTQ